MFVESRTVDCKQLEPQAMLKESCRLFSRSQSDPTLWLLKASGGTLTTLAELPIAEEWFAAVKFA
jgi:hypothetical protein